MASRAAPDVTADRQEAEDRADLLIDIGKLDKRKREGYIKGWMHPNFYRSKRHVPVPTVRRANSVKGKGG